MSWIAIEFISILKIKNSYIASKLILINKGSAIEEVDGDNNIIDESIWLVKLI